MKLEVCNHCARHVRPDEAECPFCGTSRRSPARLGVRVAAAVMTAALVQAACKDDPAPVPAYGIAPMEDAGSADSGVRDAGS